MDPLLPDTNQLLNNLFSDEEKIILKEIEKELFEDNQLYSFERLWIFDKYIGGIGAYSMPADPTKNPLPGGIGRTIYRPLQYARSNIENNINVQARYVIQNVGLHLEGLVKYIIKKERIIEIMPLSKMSLGQGIYKLKKHKYDQDIFVNLNHILKIYNLSKHGLNDDEKRSRTFSPLDAIVFYLASRKIGNTLLNNYRVDLYKEMSKYIDRLEIHEIYQSRKMDESKNESYN